MLLCHSGYKTDPLDFVDKYLDAEPVRIKLGCRYGPNPKHSYAGDPRSEKNGWGCFAPVIVRDINKRIDDDKHIAVNLTGKTLNELCRDYIDSDIPVAVWVTVGMEEIDRINLWQSEDGSQTYLYPANEHCMVLVGHDEDNYIMADPYGSNGIVYYPVEKTEIAFASLGRQAVAITEK